MPGEILHLHAAKIGGAVYFRMVSEQESCNHKKGVLSIMLRMFEHLGRAREPLTFIRDNEDFFMRVTINKLDEKVNGLTRYTDGATYVNEQLFRDRYGAYVPWSGMSTGGKTVLNVFYNPELCFNTAECGENAAADLKNLKQG